MTEGTCVERIDEGFFADQRELIAGTSFLRLRGSVEEVTGLTVRARGFPAVVGGMCRVRRRSGGEVEAQVVGVSGLEAVLMPLEPATGIGAGDAVLSDLRGQHVGVGAGLLGRVLDGRGRAIDGGAPPVTEEHRRIFDAAPAALSRTPIEEPLATGVRAIDGFLTLGTGQRMGVFAGTGVGKSVLMGMISRFTSADVIVVALVGERGREVGDFIRKDLGEEGRRRSVLVVSTSDESPVLRVRACFTAMAVAEHFRDRGKHVLLLMDSVTRMAMAQRQIGLAAGEPPTTKGYPPSVFSLMPQLMERCGRTSRGSITGLFTVLVEGDDLTEPIADAARGILDGHIWLSRDLANRGHFPAVSVLESISRVMSDVAGPTHVKAARGLRGVLATWASIEDLVNIGAYSAGSNAAYDAAIRMKPELDAFLRQDRSERASLEETRAALYELAALAGTGTGAGSVGVGAR